MKPNKPKKQSKAYVPENPIEAIRGISGTVKKSVKDDLLEASVHDAWNQLTKRSSGGGGEGELSAGEELNLEVLEKQTIRVTEQGRSYSQEIIKAGGKANRRESQGIEVRMQEILIEIKQLSKSSKELSKKVQVEVIEQGIQDPGVYHQNFLDKILLSLKEARENVEDGLAWFQALTHKKAQRQYGIMAKKHGTSFTLSQERMVSTQTG